MRFPIHVPNLPHTYPKELYAPVLAAPPKVRSKVELVVHPDLKRILRYYASLIPPSFFSDRNIFPCSPEVLRRLAVAEPATLTLKKWYSGEYVLADVGDRLVLSRVTVSRVHDVCEGDSYKIFEYAVKYCLAALPILVETARRGLIKHPKRILDFARELKSYRIFRNVSPGLNRISKTAELVKVDQDSTIRKFPAVETWTGNTVVWHFGSGREWATSQRALMVYEVVVCVDPLLDGENSTHVKGTWQNNLCYVPDDADIISDVSYGDAFGMVGDGMVSLVNALWAKVRPGRVILVKVNIGETYGEPRGCIVSKVRPHNAEVVLSLERDGDPIDQLLAQVREDVCEANKMRNEMILKLDFGDDYKPVDAGSSELSGFVRGKRPRLCGLKRRKRAGKTRAQIYAESIGYNRLVGRQSEWRKVCSTGVIPPGTMYSLLPAARYLDRGPVFRFDPLFSDVWFSLKSVLETAKMRGLGVTFDKEWRLC